jgi:hypothetical protein
VAKAKSHLFSTLRGSIAGVTYLGNSYQAIVARSRTAPVQPNTNAQQQIKLAWANCVAYWNAQTDAVRQKWADYAATLTFSGPLGNYNVTGRNVFMGTFALVQYINYLAPGTLAMTFTAPTTAGFLDVGDIIPAVGQGPGTGIAISVDGNASEDVIAFTQASIELANSRYFWKGPWLSSQNKVTEVPGSTTTVIEHLGYSGDDKVVFSRIRCITSDPPYRCSSQALLRHLTDTWTP